MTELLYSYQTGNVFVKLYSDGTRIQEYEGTPEPLTPLSADIKITNYCELGCAYCHEQSTVQGVHGDLDDGFKLLSVLPRGTEIAVGGGNPLAHPELVPFLTRLKDAGIIANITVNQLHLKKFSALIEKLLNEKLIHGLGISYYSADSKYLDKFMTDNTVLHMIIGVHSPDELRKVRAKWPNAKVLLLGYKTFGRGIEYGAANNTKEIMQSWYNQLHTFFMTRLTISFDNLAISQLQVKRFFSDRSWQQFYMGDDGTFTMYLDMVEQQYARSSTSADRYAATDIVEAFKHVRSM